MKRLALLLALVPTLALADKSYNSESSATHDCAKEPDVSINTGGGTFTFTGTCDKISINGGGNKVTIEAVKKVSVNGSENKVDIGAADKISVNGADNVVTYKKGLSGKMPKTSTSGVDNKLTPVK